MDRYISVAFNLPISTSFTYRLDEGQEASLGSRVIASFGKRSLAGFVVGTEVDPPKNLPEIKTIRRVLDSEPLFDENYLDLAHWMAGMYFCSLGESLSAMIPGGRREVALPGLGTDEASFKEGDIVPNDEQQRAIDAILEKERGLFYVYGITGSGKTEVFLQVAKQSIADGGSVIYLVPEISLTHQVVDTIKQRLDEHAAVLHSRLSPSQRLREWRRIQRGEVNLVIGARSAVFAPVKNLKLIILDEEHEGSYKSVSVPRYHARQIAMRRCAVEKARLVMGSATPSIEAWEQMEEGNIHRLTLHHRVAGGGMPAIEIVDMSQSTGALSQVLVERLREVHKEGRQSILFLNRRGFSYFFHCKSCGYQMNCRNCSVNLTYHKEADLMVCHYCAYKTKPVSICPECGSLDVGYSGFGTERIEEEVARLFPSLNIARADTDAVRKKGSLEKIIGDFRSGKIDILLGTQMVAKGLNFPGVKLVGIVLADTGLNLPDFRAAERTFALITQVSGRAGRFIPDGEVIIQTFHPENQAILKAKDADLEAFYTSELSVRNALAFPPFTRLIRLVFRAKRRDRVSASAARMKRDLAKSIGAEALLGPSECPLSVLSGNYRKHIIVRTRQFGKTHRQLKTVLETFKPPSGVYLEVDVDPVSLL